MNHTGKAWEQGRQATLSRDDRRCQDCGRYDEIHVHHIKRPEEFEEYDAGHNPSNLVTLCKWCHPRWEGREARPVLLEDGITIQAIVSDLTTDTVERLVHVNAAERMYSHLVEWNGGACNKCYRPRDRYRAEPAAHLRSYVQTIVQNSVYGMERELTQLTTTLEWRANKERSEYYCEECGETYEYYSDSAKVGMFIKSAWRISEVLAAQGVRHDGKKLRDAAEKLKREQNGSDRMLLIAATAYAIRAGHAEVKRPEWLRDEVEC